MATLAHESSAAKVDERRLRLALDASEPGKLDTLHQQMVSGKLPARAMCDMLLCELSYVHALLSGGTYYDYEAQRWVEGGGA